MHHTNHTYRMEQGAVVLLAAGASRRLGTPKQFLSVAGSTLLQQAVQVALGLSWNPVVVVVAPHQYGSSAQLLQEMPVEVITNDAWEEGMAASIRCGISHLQLNYPSCDGAMLMVCDQPRLTTDILIQLRTLQQQTAQPATAAFYSNRPGTPALIHHTWFDKLLNLRGDTGARKLLLQQPESVALLNFPEGAIDIDTPQDLSQLIP